uniref:RING-type domain-containing protein n=1 Tax=Hucho hucho TaxID=62062 RepID=A0A4W5MQA9_9TELE
MKKLDRNGSLLSEDQFQCSICRDVFIDPVFTPCGHNFCKACIGGYWDTTGLCQCPMCKHNFYIRPELKTNTTLRDVAYHFKELEQEINEVLRRSTELKQLSHTEDHLHLLQSSPSLCTPPNAKNWSEISIQIELMNVMRVLRSSVSELEETTRKAFSELMEKCNKAVEKFPDNLKIPDKLKIPDNLKSMQQYAVDVTLDPDTANSFLGLSADGKQVSVGQTWNVRPDNPKRFVSRCILGKEGFSSGRFYYEVQGRNCWELGVARESIDKSIEDILRVYSGFRASTDP